MLRDTLFVSCLFAISKLCVNIYYVLDNDLDMG